MVVCSGQNIMSEIVAIVDKMITFFHCFAFNVGGKYSGLIFGT